MPDKRVRGDRSEEARRYREKHGAAINERQRARLAANRDEVNAARRQKYAERRTEISARRRVQYAADPEPLREATRRWRETNRERHAAYSRRWRAENIDRARAADKAKKLANPTKVNELNARRRARKRAATVGRVDYDAILQRDSGICHICVLPVAPTELHFDHVIPLARGGAHSQDNIRVAHALCNLRKATKVAA